MKKQLLKSLFALCAAVVLTGTAMLVPESFSDISSTLSASAAETSGTCGTSLRWSISGTTLTITGSGAMTNYSSPSYQPWNSYAATIKVLVLPDTMTSIGKNAFRNLTSLQYVYTKNSSGSLAYNLPSKLTQIGERAFYGCKAFRGNNSTCTLNIGVQGTTKSACSIGKYAFGYCASLIKVKFYGVSSSKILDHAFYKCTGLTYVSLYDGVSFIGQSAFAYCTNLSKVDMNLIGRVIYENAFSNTAWGNTSSGYLTSLTYEKKNAGSAKTLVGNQAVVNIFIEEVSTILPTAVKSGKKTETSNGIVEWSQDIYSDCILLQSQSGKISAYKKNDIRYAYDSDTSWDMTKSSSSSASAAVCLNQFDYHNLFDNQNIPYSTQNGGKQKGYYGSYVTSQAMTQRLQTLNTALDDLEAQATNYGKELNFYTSSETNYYFTAVDFDINQTPIDAKRTCYITDSNGQIIGSEEEELGYSYLYFSNSIYGERGLNDCVFNELSALTANNGTKIDLSWSNDATQYSQFAKQIISDYAKKNIIIDGVICLFHTKKNGETMYAKPCSSKSSIGRDEYCVLNDNDGGNDSSTASTYEHEICHAYGAYDLYNANNSDGTIRNHQLSWFARNMMDYYNKKGFRDIMLSSYKTNILSSITAYSVGWSNVIDKDLYNVLFCNKTYNMGDVNKDGKKDSLDTSCIQDYKSGRLYLSPVQKYLAGL